MEPGFYVRCLKGNSTELVKVTLPETWNRIMPSDLVIVDHQGEEWCLTIADEGVRVRATKNLSSWVLVKPESANSIMLCTTKD